MHTSKLDFINVFISFKYLEQKNKNDQTMHTAKVDKWIHIMSFYLRDVIYKTYNSLITHTTKGPECRRNIEKARLDFNRMLAK